MTRSAVHVGSVSLAERGLSPLDLFLGLVQNTAVNVHLFIFIF